MKCTLVKSDNLPLGIRWTYFYEDKPHEIVYWSYEKLLKESGVKDSFF